MASLNFTEVENRTARSGLSNGVVYYKSGAEVWHGLRSVSVREYSGPANYIYLDGQPISVDNPTHVGEYSLSSFTYPRSLPLGYKTPYTGVSYYTGANELVDISWRTKSLSNNRTTYVYHFLLNCLVSFREDTFTTETTRFDAQDFVFDIKSFPKLINGVNLSYFWVDTRALNSIGVGMLERKIYGTSSTNPTIPTFEWFNALMADNPYSEVENEVGVGMHKLKFAFGDDVQGNPSVGLYKVKDTAKIREVSPGIYTYK